MINSESQKENWDITCTDCGKFILTEEREYPAGPIRCIAGSYEDGYYDEFKAVFYCIECAKRRGMND